MSFSDSEFQSQAGGEYKFFRQISRERLLFEMLGSAKKGKGESKSSWKVLIMDKVTVKVMSHSCKMADITDQGVSLVEDLFRRREPMPCMDAVYFMQPTKENIVMFLSDMSGRMPLYRIAYVFFSSPIPKELVNHIKNDTSVLPRIGALREMNLEYFSMDNQAYTTDHEKALEELFGEHVATNSRRFEACINTIATRVATVFASLKELPHVRYRAAKIKDWSAPSAPELIPSKFAALVWDCISKYKSTIPNYPQSETCELLILDRSIDQIAPVIHEWTYDAMCHDLLDLDGNKYIHEVPSKTGGEPEKKEILLEDHDPVWLELRHVHIADASERLHDKMTNFVSKNKAAQLHQNSREGYELSTRDLQKMVQALPQYNEQMDKLSAHVAIAGKLNTVIREMGLRELGQLEQDLVFGDAGAKDVINFLRTRQDASSPNKLRLLMIYAIVYPEKFEGDKGTKLMQLAKLSPEHMKVVKNMRLLEGSSSSNKMSTLDKISLKFDGQKKKNASRKDRSGEDEETWQLFRFYPMIEELIENLCNGELLKSDYPYVNDPSPPPEVSSHSGSARSRAPTAPASGPPRAPTAPASGPPRAPTAPASGPPTRNTNPHSMRSRRTAHWAQPRLSDDGNSSDSVLKNASGDTKKMGQRIFVFIIGGATRSELRVCHKLTAKFKREVVLGSTSFDDPPEYVAKLKLLTEAEVSTDGIHSTCLH